MASASPAKFTAEDAKCALRDILAAFETPENTARMHEVRESAGNDMLKTMQMVFPVATQIQMAVIPKYGFTGDGEGIIRFTQTVKLYERNDEELGALNNQLRTIVMPLMAAPAPPEPPVSDNPISPAPASPAAAAAMSPMVAAVGSPPGVSQATS